MRPGKFEPYKPKIGIVAEISPVALNSEGKEREVYQLKAALGRQALEINSLTEKIAAERPIFNRLVTVAGTSAMAYHVFCASPDSSIGTEIKLLSVAAYCLLSRKLLAPALHAMSRCLGYLLTQLWRVASPVLQFSYNVLSSCLKKTLAVTLFLLDSTSFMQRGFFELLRFGKNYFLGSVIFIGILAKGVGVLQSKTNVLNEIQALVSNSEGRFRAVSDEVVVAAATNPLIAIGLMALFALGTVRALYKTVTYTPKPA